MPIYEIREWVDMLHVQRCAGRAAAEVGFSKREQSELSIVATELASNVLKYGIRGSMEIRKVEGEQGIGLELVARDSGPPFHDFATALKDGWDDRGPIDPLEMLSRGGIGGGLGAVQRLTDALSVESDAGGKRVRAVRYLADRRPKHG